MNFVTRRIGCAAKPAIPFSLSPRACHYPHLHAVWFCAKAFLRTLICKIDGTQFSFSLREKAGMRGYAAYYNPNFVVVSSALGNAHPLPLPGQQCGY
jgi:hypothetical protein